MGLPEFVFVHIPKTGGGTIRRIFGRVYKEQMIYDRTFRQDRKQWGFVLLNHSLSKYPADHRNYKLIIGHFDYHKYSHLNRQQVTFLRHPVERIHSYYTVWTRREQFRDGTVEQFCELCPNYMTFMTGGNLKRFAFVGLTEEFNESIVRLNKLFKVNFPLNYKKYHVSSDKRKLTKQEIKTIRKYNRKDLELYNEAKRLFGS